MSDPTALTAGSSVSASAPWWRSGKLIVLVVALGLGAAFYLYSKTLPPPWLRAFGADIALRASADPNAALPEDTREATPRGLADNPLICLQRLVRQPWDRVVFVTYDQGKMLETHPTLSGAQWDDRAAAQAQLTADDRYQLIVLMRDGRVIDHQLFYTFWADLSGLARSEGFAPADAIFTAQSLAGRYVLSPTVNVAADSCPQQ